MEAFLATLVLAESLQNSWFDGLSIFGPQNQELSLARVTEKNNKLKIEVLWPVRGSNPRHSRY